MRWLLGGELHPGGEALTRRAFELIDLDARSRLLDVGSGDGAAVLLAAAEHRCRAVGVEYGAGTVEDARRRAREVGLADRVEFVSADAEALPFADRAFDAVVSECSLCTFADKPRAADEMRRVLVRGGRLGLADVVAEVERLPGELRGALGAVACVAEAL
ncbi:MAG: class I SAM-dependent methyltransferase, partial [Solirubrobacterales bacterium]